MSPRYPKQKPPVRVEWGHPLWRDPEGESSAVPTPELVEGCIQSAVLSIRRLRVVLDRAPRGSFKRIHYLQRLQILEASAGLVADLRAKYYEDRK